MQAAYSESRCSRAVGQFLRSGQSLALRQAARLECERKIREASRVPESVRIRDDSGSRRSRVLRAYSQGCVLLARCVSEPVLAPFAELQRLSARRLVRHRRIQQSVERLEHMPEKSLRNPHRVRIDARHRYAIRDALRFYGPQLDRTMPTQSGCSLSFL